MSYAAAVEQLNAMAPELFTRPGQPRRKFSLDQVRVLLDALGNPQSRFPSVLIAGTNGKGSTAATLASILTESGVRTGLYTSPHLERVNERVRIGRTLIGDDDFARYFFAVHDTAEELVRQEKLPQLPSFFEFLTALAFLYFARADVEIAVLEVGLGGRLDATNVVHPLLSIVTDISLDHMEWLGSTLAEIAREKAGILRPRGTLVTLPQHPEASRILGEVAAELDVTGVSATTYMPPIGVHVGEAYPVAVLGSVVQLASPLVGAHQHRNVALAVAAAVELRERHGFPITADTVAAGVRRTSWPGRLETIRRDGIDWILDVAHNPAGAWALRSGLREICGNSDSRPRTLVFACLHDKPLRELAQILFPLFQQVVFAPIHSPRATPADELLAAAEATGTPAVLADSVAHALDIARHGSVLQRHDFRACPEPAKDAIRNAKQEGTFAPEGHIETSNSASVLKGHDFSRAVRSDKQEGALAPEGRIDTTNPDDVPGSGPIVIVSGSIYLVGEARSLLLSDLPCESGPVS